MANSRQSATIFSPSSKRPTKRTRSSITEHSFQGIASSPRGGSVTYVSGTNCHPCVGSLIRNRICGGFGQLVSVLLMPLPLDPFFSTDERNRPKRSQDLSYWDRKTAQRQQSLAGTADPLGQICSAPHKSVPD